MARQPNMHNASGNNDAMAKNEGIMVHFMLQMFLNWIQGPQGRAKGSLEKFSSVKINK